MEESGTFDRLVSELSAEERKDLLRRIEARVTVSSAPLFQAEDLPVSVELERRFNEESWFLRLWLRILSAFRGKTPIKLYEDRLASKIGIMIESRAPGLYERRRNYLLSGFRDELRSLKESARFFYEVLDGSIVRDRAAFFAFLASLEMDFIHTRLALECDPYVYAAAHPKASEAEVRQATMKALDEILKTITEEQRTNMYRNVRALFCLKELACFLFDRALSSFSLNAEDKDYICPIFLLQEQLASLANILFSLDTPPSLPLLETLFLFKLQEKTELEGFDLIAETEGLMSKAEDALTRIREFNRSVPLTDLVRCATRNLDFLPKAIPGGEDWFAVLRDYWKRRIEERQTAFVRDKRREQLKDSLSLFLKGKPIEALSFAVSPSASSSMDAIPVRWSFCLSFLASFYKTVFVEDINKTLKSILIDGEFYKKENKIEFTDAYNEILKLGDSVSAFDRRLSPSGDLGKRFDAIRNEVIALSLKRRKIQNLIQEADGDALALIDQAERGLNTLNRVLDGILNGEAGGRYDSLSNLGSLSGRSGVFMTSLRNTSQKIDKAVQLLSEIKAMEVVWK